MVLKFIKYFFITFASASSVLAMIFFLIGGPFAGEDPLLRVWLLLFVLPIALGIVALFAFFIALGLVLRSPSQINPSNEGGFGGGLRLGLYTIVAVVAFIAVLLKLHGL